MQVQNEYAGYFRSHVKFDFTLDRVKFEAQFVEKQLDLIEKMAAPLLHKDKPVLEIGSGFGRLYYLLSQRGYSQVSGIEPDPEACEFTNRTFGPHFLNQAVLDLDKEFDGKYQTIFSFETLEHLHEPMQCIRKIHSLLNDKGVFIGTSPFPARGNIISDKTHVFVLHPENWKRLFELAGFRRVTYRPMTFIPSLWRISGRLNFILPFYFPFLKFVSTTLIIAEK